jgi:hypothetical protein
MPPTYQVMSRVLDIINDIRRQEGLPLVRER